jgi:hypothetical protein
MGSRVQLRQRRIGPQLRSQSVSMPISATKIIAPNEALAETRLAA